MNLVSLKEIQLKNEKGTLFVLTMHSAPDNRFTYEFINEWNKQLDYIEEKALSKSFLGKGAALITTHGCRPGEEAAHKMNVFSNGLVLDILKQDGVSYVAAFQRLMERILTFCLPTVACIDGHAFAGGCMLALAHDFRVMNAKRGYLCMNEVELPGALTPGMFAIIKCKISQPQQRRQCVLEARRFTANDAIEAGIVDAAVDPSSGVTLLQKSIELASREALRVAKSSIVYHYLKKELYSDTSDLLLNAQLGYVWNNLRDLKLLMPKSPVSALENLHGQVIPTTKRLFKL